MTQSRGPEPACLATTGASRLKTLGRKSEFCLESSLPPTCHLINLGCCYIPHFLRGRYICLLCLNIHLKCISLCKCPLIYIILYKCTNPVIVCGFLNALFSFMLGSVSLFPSCILPSPQITHVTVVDTSCQISLCFAQLCMNAHRPTHMWDVSVPFTKWHHIIHVSPYLAFLTQQCFLGMAPSLLVHI